MMKQLSPGPRRIGMSLAVPAAATVVAFAAVVTFDGPPRATAATPKPPESPVRYSADGELLRPTGYRKWTFVGTPLTPNDMNRGQAPFPEFHTVYINPEAYNHYENVGAFPDGTVLVKELVSVGTKAASSGNGYFMGDFIGLEVAIKDKTRFKNEPGNWAYFTFGHEYPLKKQVGPQAVANCNACHGGLADDDYVFTQYYPVLRAAKDSTGKK